MKDSTAKEIAEKGSSIGGYEQPLLDLEENYCRLRIIFPLHAEKLFNYFKKSSTTEQTSEISSRCLSSTLEGLKN